MLDYLRNVSFTSYNAAFFFLLCPYLPHRQHKLPVFLCPDRFLMGIALEMHYPVSRSGLEDMAEL